MSRFGEDGEDIIGKWSEDKLDLLAKYLEAYSIIMNKQKEKWLTKYYYIDAFAGSLRPRAKDDEKRYIKGSPLRALQIEPKFDGYWFIDISSQRIERIERLKDDFSDCNIEVYHGNCNEVLCDQLIPKFNSSSTRAFVFLDPYGLSIDWETITKLANTRKCDIFVNFSVMGITRILPKDREPKPEHIELLNRVMGNTDWITEVYKQPPTVQLSLFPEQSEQTSSLKREIIKAEWLADLYTKQLRTIFQYVSQPVLMKNSTNSVLYALCLASHNKTAVKITNDIFKLYEKLKLQE
ncbi:unknown [Crocosphaera subtropica ATCC 51142]|uniref:Three-Cys-motif partner protein TcmP n=1 Tax=Crocosphaera subtropica (strain ATCC 51142 / BH68) TaxID=43989 RepID=B1WSX5_CROS5|nr:three-Cys-motif partner protein TcmP [Crocosphaera subtropica]ACB50305.1 unknown [Crocosphaera subtropica ATCC 51142]